MKQPEAMTTDQQFFECMLVELRKANMLQQRLLSLLEPVDPAEPRDSEEYVCPEGKKPFRNDRALRAHMRVHKGGDAE